MKILVAVDGSNTSAKALKYVLKNFPQGNITVAHVAVPELEWGGFYESWDSAAERGRAILERMEKTGVSEGYNVSTELLEGETSSAITTFAKENGFDLITLGHRGTTDKRRKLLGSVAQEVLEKANCSVLVVKPENQFSNR